MANLAKAQIWRRRSNAALFLGPALLLLGLFFVVPIIVALVLAFTDMGRTLAVTQFTFANLERMVTRDTRLVGSLGVTAVFVLATLGMIIFTSAIRSIPEHLFHAASVDGAGSLSVVRHVVLPALRWPISYMVIHQSLSLLVSFEYILLITGGGPFYDTTVFALYAYRRAFENGEYAYGAALSLILVFIGVATALVLWRFMDMKRLLQPPRIEVH